jgi:hypothetical protein
MVNTDSANFARLRITGLRQKKRRMGLGGA